MIERHGTGAKHWPNTKIAQWCGCTEGMIRQRKEKTDSYKYETDSRVTGSDGKSYPATKPRKPAPETETEGINGDTGKMYKKVTMVTWRVQVVTV